MRIYLAVIVTIACLPSGPAHAEDPQQLFDSVYGEEYRRARATADRGDDLELATQLLAAAKADTTHAAVAALMCDRVYDLASPHADGRETAIRAMRRLIETDAARTEEADTKIARMLESSYRETRGDDKKAVGLRLLNHLERQAERAIEASDPAAASDLYRRALGVATYADPSRRATLLETLRGLREDLLIVERIEAAKKRLDANPKNTRAATELVQLLLVEMDDPASARKYSFLVDEPTQKMLRLSDTPPGNLKPDQLFELGGWYEGLAEGATRETAERAMMLRAIDYYDRFLATHAEKDLRRTKATLTVQKLKKAVADGPAPGPGRAGGVRGARTHDMMAKITDPRALAVMGNWTREDGVIKVNMTGRSRMEVPVEPGSAYELTVEVRPVQAFNNTIGGVLVFAIPINDRTICLMIKTQHEDASSASVFRANGITTGKRIEGKVLKQNEWNTITLRVKEERDTVTIGFKVDNKTVYEWTGPKGRLLQDNYWQLKNRSRLGIATSMTAAEFRKIEFHDVSGKAKIE